jgi:hypothetical protein
VVYAPIATSPAPAQAVQFVNRDRGCLDIKGGKTADGSTLIQWPCNGAANQRWSYDAATGLVRSMQDPHFCLDNSGTYANGASVVIWTCNGNSNQRFTYDSTSGSLALRNAPNQVVDAARGSGAGGNVLTWSNWRGPTRRGTRCLSSRAERVAPEAWAPHWSPRPPAGPDLEARPSAVA